MTKRQVTGRVLRAGVSVAAILWAAGLAHADSTPHYAIDDRLDALEAELQRLRQERARSGNREVDLKVYGQASRAVMGADDGIDSDTFHVDNDHSSTRVGWEGKARINDYWTAGAKIEVEFESNSSAAVGLANATNQPQSGGERVGNNSFRERKMEFWLDYMINDNSRARVTLGQGDTASNGTSEKDESGTKVILSSAPQKYGGAFQFRQPMVGNTFSGVSIANVFNNLDGFSRDDRIRFDLAHGPFMISYSNVANERNDIGVHFSHTTETWDMSAGIGYGVDNDGNRNNGPIINASATEPNGETTTINGSFSVRHIPTGINGTFAAGQRKRHNPVPGFDFNPMQAGIQGPNDRHFYYAKVGWIGDLWGGEVGNTGFAVDYFHTEDAVVTNDEGRAFGIAAVQEIDAAAMDIYIGYRHFEYEAAGFAPFLDIDVVMAGGRVKF